MPFVSVPPFLTLPRGVTAHTVPLADVTIAVLSAGDPTSPTRALLVPGFTGSKEDFIAVLPLLAHAGVHVVAYDQAGQYESRSEAEESRFSIDALAADVHALAAAIWPSGPRPHLVGHSLGGLVARAAVLARSHAFASLTCLSSGPGAVPEPQRPPLELLRAVLPDTSLAQVWEAKVALDESRGMPVPAGEIGAFLRTRWVAGSPHALRAKAGMLLTEPDRTALLAATGVTAAVVFGSDDDVWSPTVQEEMAQALGAPVTEIAGVGHSPAADAPDETADALLGHWREMALVTDP